MKTVILTCVSRGFYGANSCSQHSLRSTVCWPIWLQEAWNWPKIFINAIKVSAHTHAKSKQKLPQSNFLNSSAQAVKKGYRKKAVTLISFCPVWHRMWITETKVTVSSPQLLRTKDLLLFHLWFSLKSSNHLQLALHCLLFLSNTG